jgi:DNA mismatch repair protein MutL
MNNQTRINILPPEVYNLLSAGEVVENPASVVKELVENAIDAGADKINVAITGGGIDEITVTDNGSGCGKDELSKVFLPHATSKISSAADIDSILSLGFRGEAMASIAAVAQVEFISKPAAQEHAVKITNNGKTEIVSGNNGTAVRVANLFYNTPARRKFQKSENTEKNLVTNVIHNIIFSHPFLHIKYTVDGEVNIDFRGAGLLSAVKQIYGVNDEMSEMSYKTAGIAIGGYISNIKLAKKNKSRQTVIVNGRVIDGGIIAQTVNEVMSNYLMGGEYPVFVLTAEIDTAKIDVNVHPQKKEIRFADRDFIINAVEMAVIKALDEYFLRQRESQIPKNEPAFPQYTTGQSANESALPQYTGERRMAGKLVGKSFDPTATEHKSEEVFLRAMSFLSGGAPHGAAVASGASVLHEFAAAPQIELPPEVVQTRIISGSDYQILGQVFETYLLAATAEQLLIIDQHAMAERINYDKFTAAMNKNNIAAQALLDSVIIKLSPKEQIAFEKIKPHLTAMGFECDEFGTDSIRVSAIPAAMSAYGIDEFLRCILADRELMTDKLSDILKDRIAMAACKASIRAGDILTHEQIASFMENYKKSKAVPLCPHGRPTIIAYSKSKIENLFGRK